MKYIHRHLSDVCLQDLKHFPILTLSGPRQSGKSTLLKKLLPDWQYVNLEEPSNFDFAENDPKGFLSTYSNHVVIDEIQRVPRLISQLQVEVDREREPGRFAITGSHNLLLLESVSQSLAGRTAMRYLLPFSNREIQTAGLLAKDIESVLFYGGYPNVYDLPAAAKDWLNAYIQTYIERDVRMIRKVSDLGTFRRMVKLCSARAGQLLDLSAIGNDSGVSHNTIKDWINILETGFIVFRLQPYFRNFSKRLIKSPKLYFYDTGVLCQLLDIRSPSDLMIHPYRGAIFENWCVVESLKYYLNKGVRPPIYFWRDQTMEVDLLVETSIDRFWAIEIKSGRTPISDFAATPLKLKTIAKDIEVSPAIVYGGDQTQIRSDCSFFGWKHYLENMEHFFV